MLILRVALPLDVPIFDCADDVGFVRRAELDFDLVAPLRLGVLQQEVKTTRARLHALFVT